jgi:AraC-like DNA-binding protein
MRSAVTPHLGPRLILLGQDDRMIVRPFAPRAVKRALDYMHANVETPIAFADIIAASGVAERTLFEQFRAFTGMSPMRYLREARYTAARTELRQGGPDARVTELAMRLGFTHLGRFAIGYRRRFDETPRATLAAARCARQETQRFRLRRRPLRVGPVHARLTGTGAATRDERFPS